MSWQGDLFVIDESNAQRYADEALERNGGLTAIFERTNEFGGLECAAPLADAIELVPDSEWIDRVNEREKLGQFPYQRRKWLSKKRGKSVVKNQGSLGYCHVFALTNCVEYNRQSAGLDYVELAPESLGGVVGWQNRGGVMNEDIAWAAQHGIAAREYIPYLTIATSRFKANWQDNAKLHAPTEWYELGKRDMWRETVSALLAPEPLPIYPGFSWWSHSVMEAGLKVVDREVCLVVENSWDFSWGDEGYGILRGTKKVPTAGFGCYAPRAGVWSKS